MISKMFIIKPQYSKICDVLFEIPSQIVQNYVAFYDAIQGKSFTGYVNKSMKIIKWLWS